MFSQANGVGQTEKPKESKAWMNKSDIEYGAGSNEIFPGSCNEKIYFDGPIVLNI
jgi:hypothetical protein